jgi:hypothetical protein
MWVHLAVCELVAMNLGSLAKSVGSRSLIFAEIMGSKSALFASPSLTVCRPLHLIRSSYRFEAWLLSLQQYRLGLEHRLARLHLHQIARVTLECHALRGQSR